METTGSCQLVWNYRQNRNYQTEIFRPDNQFGAAIGIKFRGTSRGANLAVVVRRVMNLGHMKSPGAANKQRRRKADHRSPER